MKINIGTTKGSIVGVEIKKLFKNITFSDIKAIVSDSEHNGASIIGWCPTNHKLTKYNKQ